MDPRQEMVQEVYEATSSSDLEEMATQYLEETQPDKTLQSLVQWVPQCTRESITETMRMMVTRCSELKNGIEYVLSCHVMTS